jgi:hypothetical protein
MAVSPEFGVREEIQYRCYLTLPDPPRPATEEDCVAAMQAWRRRAVERFGPVQFGHVGVSVLDSTPGVGVARAVEICVTGLVAPIDPTA